MKEIKLSQYGKNKGKFVALVDDEDFEYLNKRKWYTNKAGDTYYAERIVCKPQRICIKMHREIMKTPDNMECDHVFHNGLDNRKFIEVDGILKQNLRNCTRQQNQMNKSKRRNSKYLGISHFTCNYKGKEYQYIKATIMVNRKKIHLGCFKTEELAAMAFDEAAKHYRGEFANLNFK